MGVGPWTHYDFRADLLDTFQSAPDVIKALMLILPTGGFITLCLGTLVLLLHHRRLARQMEQEFEDLREARRIQRERWLQVGDKDFRRRLTEAFEARPPERLPDRPEEGLTMRRGLLGKWPKDGEEEH